MATKLDSNGIDVYHSFLKDKLRDKKDWLIKLKFKMDNLADTKMKQLNKTTLCYDDVKADFVSLSTLIIQTEGEVLAYEEMLIMYERCNK